MREARVFVSSTNEDLAADCRPAVRSGIVHGGGHEVAMETWDGPYVDALSICRQKICEESTHYLGLFGYYRGWVPPSSSASIVELEYGWASEHLRGSRSMAVFVPREGSPIALTLRRRAESDLAQRPDDLAAQETFLERVRAGGFVMPFGSAWELSARAARRVRDWTADAITQHEAVPAADARATDQFWRAYFRPQLRAAEDAWDQRGGRPLCLLLDDRTGYGWQELLRRLGASFLDGAALPTMPIHLRHGALSASWGLPGLVVSLAEQVSPGEPTTDLDELAVAVAKLLADRDVLLKVTAVRGYPGGATAFLADFWTPLAAAVERTRDRTHPGRLVCCAVAPRIQNQQFDVVSLPEAQLCSVRLVEEWLRPRIGSDATERAQQLITDTDGIPDLLAEVLR